MLQRYYPQKTELQDTYINEVLASYEVVFEDVPDEPVDSGAETAG